MGRRRLDVKHLYLSQQDVNAVAKPASVRIQTLSQSIIVDFLLQKHVKKDRKREEGQQEDSGRETPGPQSTTSPAVNAF